MDLEGTLIVGIAIAILSGAVGFYAGHHTEELAANSRAAALQEAQDRAVADAQAKVIAAQNAQRAAADAAEKDYAELKNHADDLSGALTDSLRRLTAERHRSPVPASSSTPAQPLGTTAESPSDRGLAETAGRAGAACLEDAARLAALQEWVRGSR